MILVTGGAVFIGANFVLDWLAQPLAKNGYGQYLQRLLKEVGPSKANLLCPQKINKPNYWRKRSA